MWAEQKNAHNDNITQMELTYEGHAIIEMDELESNHLFAKGMVKDWWIKYGTLYIELEDGTVKEESIDVSMAFDTLDTKHPTAIMIEDKEGNWHRHEAEESKTMYAQGYNDKMDESMGMRHRGSHSQSMKDRRDEAWRCLDGPINMRNTTWASDESRDER